MWNEAVKHLAIFLSGIGGAGVGWLIGCSVYYFTEVLPFRYAPDPERVFHAIDGGVPIAILTLWVLIPGCTIVGFLVGNYLLKRRKAESFL